MTLSEDLVEVINTKRTIYLALYHKYDYEASTWEVLNASLSEKDARNKLLNFALDLYKRPYMLIDVSERYEFDKYDERGRSGGAGHWKDTWQVSYGNYFWIEEWLAGEKTQKQFLDIEYFLKQRAASGGLRKNGTSDLIDSLISRIETGPDLVELPWVDNEEKLHVGYDDGMMMDRHTWAKLQGLAQSTTSTSQ